MSGLALEPHSLWITACVLFGVECRMIAFSKGTCCAGGSMKTRSASANFHGRLTNGLRCGHCTRSPTSGSRLPRRRRAPRHGSEAHHSADLTAGKASVLVAASLDCGLSRAFFPRGRGEGEGASLARVTSVRLACCARASNTACHTARSGATSHDDRRGSEALEPASGQPTIGREVPAPSADRELHRRLLLS